MRSILKNNKRTRKYLEKLPKYYIIVTYANSCVEAFPFSGKYVKENGYDIPLVWAHDDMNGVCDYFFLRKITNTTTGTIHGWTQLEQHAENVAFLLSKQQEDNDKIKISQEDLNDLLKDERYIAENDTARKILTKVISWFKENKSLLDMKKDLSDFEKQYCLELNYGFYEDKKVLEMTSKKRS